MGLNRTLVNLTNQLPLSDFRSFNEPDPAVSVDLNPIRAKMENTPETSKHTSICKRAKAIKQKQRQPSQLLPLVGNPKQDMPNLRIIRRLNSIDGFQFQMIWILLIF